MLFYLANQTKANTGFLVLVTPKERGLDEEQMDTARLSERTSLFTACLNSLAGGWHWPLCLFSSFWLSRTSESSSSKPLFFFCCWVLSLAPVLGKKKKKVAKSSTFCTFRKYRQQNSCALYRSTCIFCNGQICQRGAVRWGMHEPTVVTKPSSKKLSAGIKRSLWKQRGNVARKTAYWCRTRE